MSKISSNTNIIFSNLESLISMSNKKIITDLYFTNVIINSENIHIWEMLYQFENLECLIISKCIIHRLPSFRQIKKLKILIIEYCWEICNLPDLTQLRGLEELKIYLTNPKTFEALLPKPNFSNLHLQKLSLTWLRDETELINLDTEELIITNSLGLTKLPDFSKTKNIKKLSLTDTRIESLKGIEDLKDLEILEINNALDLDNIDYINKCKKLKRIKISRCKINKICDLDNLNKLVSLELIECNKLKLLPKVLYLRYLKISEIKDNRIFYDQLPNNLVYLELDEIKTELTNLPSSLEILIVKRNSDYLTNSKIPFSCIVCIGHYEGSLNIEIDDSFY